MKVNFEIEVEVEVEVIEEENGMFSCHIPGYDIYFSTKNKEDIEKKTKVLVKCFNSSLTY